MAAAVDGAGVIDPRGDKLDVAQIGNEKRRGRRSTTISELTNDSVTPAIQLPGRGNGTNVFVERGNLAVGRLRYKNFGEFMVVF